MVGVQQWAEIRRMAEVESLSQREISRRTGLHRKTIRRALRSSEPPSYSRPPRGSKLDPFKDEINRLLKADPRVPSMRIRELITALGFKGGKTIVDDYVREVRPLHAPPRTFQRTAYAPGELCQFDLFEPSAEIPVGWGQTRRGWLVTRRARLLAGDLRNLDLDLPLGTLHPARAPAVSLPGRRLGLSLVARPANQGVELLLDRALNDQLCAEPRELGQRALGIAGGDAAGE